ncbi:MAG: twin-arginine translocase TatA/TatE family subunit [Enhygromyxa sp.]
MFGLGMMEIGLIIAVAVMLFPPKELPKLARTIARVYGQVRKTAEDFRSAVLEDEDLREPIDEIKGAYNEARFEVRDAERKARQQLAKAQMELRMATARRLAAEREAKAQQVAELEAPASGEVSAGSASEPPQAANSIAPVAAGEAEVDERGPVAGADPRVIAARRSGAYTPRIAVDDSASDDQAEEPREGVA